MKMGRDERLRGRSDAVDHPSPGLRGRDGEFTGAYASI